jgi:HD-GYP domain-containing protein (c-di-GMP phosphodiesterase class II)
MGINEEECEQIYITGLLHDIGKVGVPDHILNKTSPVTAEEMELIRQHPVIGYEILKHLSSFEPDYPDVPCWPRISVIIDDETRRIVRVYVSDQCL